MGKIEIEQRGKKENKKVWEDNRKKTNRKSFQHLHYIYVYISMSFVDRPTNGQIF